MTNSGQRVYIAARYARRTEAAVVASLLREAGFVIVSTWHDGEKDKAGTEALLQDVAMKDMIEVQAADMILTLSDQPGGFYQYGSHHVEFGMGYALGKVCVIIGPRELMFHRLPYVGQFETIYDFLEAEKDA